MKVLRAGTITGALVLMVVALTQACGARTALRGAEPCPRDDVTQACVGVCGDGVTTCVDGYWSACEIPTREESCEDVCGEGTRSCADESWSECEVPPVTEDCENDCGSGTRSCVDRTWSECEVEPVTEECTYGCGPGTRTCTLGEWGRCDAPSPLPPVLAATIRDFTDEHPDFELPIDRAGYEPGIVGDELDADAKPIYMGGPDGTLTTTGEANFYDWYHSEEAVLEIEIPLQVASFSEEFYVYENRAFFPIDNQLLGNQGRNHNFHFTLELEATFVYQSGQEFVFDGDDDIWVFINNRLVIDLGGLHESMSAGVNLDQVADEIGIVLGNEYPLKIFFAERHTVDSNFVIETSIANLGECPR